MIEKAIEELEQYNLVINNKIDNFKQSNHTHINGNTLYYKSITEGLLALNTQQPILKKVSRLGIMYDVSRCAVLTVENFKAEIRTLAMLGYDYIMIYAEDMFELDIPNFGYMRGVYKATDITEIVDYAEIFDIEVIPCIQSLGHYENFLKWDHEKNYTDTPSVLNVESVHVDELLTHLLEFCRCNFKSKTIHIGMDEANDLGRGYYLRDNSYKPQAEIFLKHLQKMYKKCINLDFNNIIIWSDMLFNFDSLAGELYDNKIDLSVLEELKKMDRLKLCYWNYWSKTTEEHVSLIASHTKVFPPNKIICAGGINQWGQLNYLVDSNVSFNALLNGMEQQHCTDLLLTIWGDGASYTNFYTSKYGIFERAFDTFQLNNNHEFFKMLFGFTQEELHVVSMFSLKVPDAPFYLWENPIEVPFSKCNRIDTDLFKSLIITEEVSVELEYTKQLVNFTIYKALLAEEMIMEQDASEYLDLTLQTYDQVYNTFREYWLTLYKLQGMGVTQSRFALIQNRLHEIEYRMSNKIEFPEIQEFSNTSFRNQFNDMFYSTNLRN